MDKDKLWILGPCTMDSRELFMEVLGHLVPLMEGRNWYMKASFDKANRTSLHGGRGTGLVAAKEIWAEARGAFPGVKFTTDVHETSQVPELVGVVDAVQIPAFLCRQTDLIVEAARHFNAINIKKGQWIGPFNLAKSVDKVRDTNPNCEAWVCDRGSNFGYHELLVNFNIVEGLRAVYDRVILDCTHATQRSRAVYGSQGDRNLAERYFVGADVFLYNGVFAEVHPRPAESTSDADCQIYLDRVAGLLKLADQVGAAVEPLHGTQELATCLLED
jgi:2-dehydro-3-deoxyphosphooctonate aldolase (KDO 8-P synthase)